MDAAVQHDADYGEHGEHVLKEAMQIETELAVTLEAINMATQAFGVFAWAAEKAGVNFLDASPIVIAKAIKAHIEKLEADIKRRDEVIESLMQVYCGCPPDTQCLDTDADCNCCRREWLATKLKEGV
jgi:predicted lipoprotein